MLSKTYGISGERVSQQLADVAGKLVADYWDNNGEDIRAIVDGSLLICLVKNGYPPLYSPEVFKKVMEQVENFEENN